MNRMVKKALPIVLTLFISNGLIYSQILEPPIITCTNVLLNGDVQLVWTLPNNSCGTFNAYNIYYSTGVSGPYNLLYSVTNQAQTTYTHVGANGQTITYYYYMVSDYNCPGYTAITSDTVDNLDPTPPQLAWVGVEGNHVGVYWYSSQSPEAAGYIIYLYDNGLYIPVDTVYGYSTTLYLDSISGCDPNTGPCSYSLAAFDACGNLGPIFSPYQSTVYLTVDTPGICETVVHMNWTNYQGWPGGTNGIGNQHVYVLGGGNWNFAGPAGATATSYDYVNSNEYPDMCFVINSISFISGWISASNMVCVPAYIFHGPENFYIRNVTVVNDGQIDVSYSMDLGADVSTYVVERSTDGSNFSQIATIPAASIVAGINVFSDLTAEADQFAYCYRLSAVDGCGNKSYSSEGCSILLTGYAFSDGTNHLDWNASQIDYGTSNGYTLYKDNSGVYSPISTTNSLSYEEVVLTDSTCYYVESENHMVLPNGIDELQISKSNIKCLIPPSAVYMPNAFSPEGKNNVFIPVFDLHGNLQSYSFSIFNRWGAELFSSADPDSGWDGKFGGKLVPQGAYAYLVTAVDASGQKIERKGTVMLLR